MVNFNQDVGNKRHYSNANRFLFILRQAFQDAGWKVVVEPRIEGLKPDLLIERGELRYVIELKSFSDGKRARLLPLLSMAILESRAAAQSAGNLRPLAIVMAPHINEAVAEDLRQFALAHAPDVALGVIDFDGLQRFWGQGLESLNAERAQELRGNAFKSDEAASHLFSDLNQWMLKVFLGQRLPEALINVPRHEFRNASQLADVADVSVMSAFRFVRQLEGDGFLDHSAHSLQLANVEKLLGRWQAAMLRPQKEIPFRWLIRGGNEERLLDVVREYQESIEQESVNREGEDDWTSRPRARLCLGGFLAAAWLGFGHVSGVPPLLYLEHIDHGLLKRLGLVRVEDARPADVFIRIPSFKESLFRAAVRHNGIQISDILQVWLESSVNPARGPEQANLIKMQVLDPILQEHQ